MKITFFAFVFIIITSLNSFGQTTGQNPDPEYMIFTIVEAVFPVGPAAFRSYLEKNLQNRLHNRVCSPAHLAIFKKCDRLTEQYEFPNRQGCVLQIAVPGKPHKKY